MNSIYSKNSKTQSSLNQPKMNNAHNNNHTDYNRLFSKQQNWEIKMGNKNIKNKIDSVMQKSRIPEPSVTRPTRKSSMAINQEKKRREIRLENQRLALRIKNAKSTINK